MKGHYITGGELYNCRLSPTGSTIFQLVFETVPADYTSDFVVKITPVAAKR